MDTKSKIKATIKAWGYMTAAHEPLTLLRSGAAHGFADHIEWLLIDLEKSGELGEMNYVGSSALDRDWWRVISASLLQDAMTNDSEHAGGLITRLETYTEGLANALNG